MNFLFRRRIEALIFLTIFIAFFGYLGSVMGAKNLLATIMSTSHDLLLNTVFFLLAITVLAGAVSKLLIEFGVVRLFEFILAPLMKPIFNLPGVAAMGGIITFLSDNPAIISLSNDKNFNSYFKKYQLISLTNFGTAFGMGLIVMTYMIGLGFFKASVVGLFGAIIGAVVSTRLMQFFVKKELPDEEIVVQEDLIQNISFKSEGSIFMRALNAILDGGKVGVDLGLAIIPGVLIISTVVMILTFGVADAAVGYQGLAYEGVALLPKLGSGVSAIFRFLFGFRNVELIAFPITSLGSVGAALSLIQKFIEEGLIRASDIAVFTAMGMCWSGYLSTHSAMLDTLNYRKFIPKALISHTIGGLLAGVTAHLIYRLAEVIRGIV